MPRIIRGLARSSKFSTKTRTEPWECGGGMRLYEDTVERTGCASQRSRHCTVKSSRFRADLEDQKWKAIQLWHGLALVQVLVELSSDWCRRQVANVSRVGRSTSHDNRAIKKKDATGKTALPFCLVSDSAQASPIYIDCCTSWRFSETLRKLPKFHPLTIACFAFLLSAQHEANSRAGSVRVIHPTF